MPKYRRLRLFKINGVYAVVDISSGTGRHFQAVLGHFSPAPPFLTLICVHRDGISPLSKNWNAVFMA